MLEWASPQQRRRVRNFLYNVGLSEEDVDSLPAPFLVVVTAILVVGLAAAGWITMLWGDSIANAYLDRFL